VKCEIVDVSENTKFCLLLVLYFNRDLQFFIKWNFVGHETGCRCYCNCTSDLVRGPIQGLKVNDTLVPKRRHTVRFNFEGHQLPKLTFDYKLTNMDLQTFVVKHSDLCVI
jgi:hypothetical protein